AEEPDTQLFADGLDLREVAAGFGAGLVQVLQRSARQLKLTGRFEADRAIRPAHRDDLAAFLHRNPPELPKLQQDIAYPAGFAIGGRGVAALPVNQLLVLGADAPLLARLLAGLHRRHELLAALDRPFLPIG